MKKKPSKRPKPKLSQKLKSAAKKLSGGDVRDFEAMYEESPKGASPREKRGSPSPRRS